MLPNPYVLKKEVFDRQMHKWMKYLGFLFQDNPPVEYSFEEYYSGNGNQELMTTVKQKVIGTETHYFWGSLELTMDMRLMFTVLMRAIRTNPYWKIEFHLQDLPSTDEIIDQINNQVITIGKKLKEYDSESTDEENSNSLENCDMIQDYSQFIDFLKKPKEEQIVRFLQTVLNRKLTTTEYFWVKYLLLARTSDDWKFTMPTRRPRPDFSIIDQMCLFANMRKLSIQILEMDDAKRREDQFKHQNTKLEYGVVSKFSRIDEVPYVDFARSQTQFSITLNTVNAFFERHPFPGFVSTNWISLWDLRRKYAMRIPSITEDCFTSETKELRMSYPKVPEETNEKRNYHGNKNQYI